MSQIKPSRQGGHPKDRRILVRQANQVMPRRGIVIGTVTPVQFDRLMEFGEKPNHAGQDIQEFLAVMAHSAVERLKRARPDRGAIVQHLLAGQRPDQNFMLVVRRGLCLPLAHLRHRHPPHHLRL